ncbi:uncharacterized protein LOC122512148 isoform X2 [Leptopilina heterotoma]|nr:uncharacterized protein LOC122512148 isoform X2 [Leptopilina heterotoma]XP_043483774.1 uncharacterized protein LOC122512148 isoform X2 [Leptopilina heterotoma]XP_043483775.1 uncharacterized protein LOC122512148 isoform X2 [Leptopilina heterotoma]
MVRGLQEKQYQLAAHKRHEANLKYNYYKETVRFFTRENVNSKQFNSWCSKEMASLLDKPLKAQQLRQRQSQLKSLFQEEQDQYDKELLELKSHKNPSPDYSIEALKRKLKEKKAEQSLYLPKDCRRFQSNFYNTGNPNQSLFSNEKFNSEFISKDSHPQKNDSPKSNQSPINDIEFDRKTVSSTIDNSVNVRTHQITYQSQLLGTGVKQALYDHSKEKINNNSSTRSSCRSLEETNIRNSDELTPFRTIQRPQFNESLIHSQCEASTPSNEVPINQINTSKECTTNSQQISDSNQTTDIYVNNLKASDEISESCFSQDDSSNSIKNKNNPFENPINIALVRENPKYKRLTTQMFHYLANKDLQEQILNLSKREFQACRKQWWSQAIRLREMKNKLELIKEQNIYNTLLSQMDSKTKKIERHKIAERSTIISQREKICESANVYDEEAKVLWKQWILEDELTEKLDSLEERNILLAQLEKEWQILNQKDKKRIDDFYQNVIFKSKIQDEYNLAEDLR